MVSLTDYLQAIAEHIQAVGHKVSWKPLNNNTIELRIDGESACKFYDGRPRVESVYEGPSFVTTWRKRKLPAVPRKAAATLLDRHAAVLRANAAQEALNERQRARQKVVAALKATLTGVATVYTTADCAVILRFPSLTVEQAERIARAYRGMP